MLVKVEKWRLKALLVEPGFDPFGRLFVPAGMRDEKPEPLSPRRTKFVDKSR